MNGYCEGLRDITIAEKGFTINGQLRQAERPERDLFQQIQEVALEILTERDPSSPIIYCILKKQSGDVKKWDELGPVIMQKAMTETASYPELAERVKQLLNKVSPTSTNQ